MRVTMGTAGRLVIPKKVRDEAGLQAGMELDVRACDGRIEVEPVQPRIRLEREGRFLVVVSDDPMPPITNDLVNETLEEIRREREQAATGRAAAAD